MWFAAIIDGYMEQDNILKHKVKYKKRSWMRVKNFDVLFSYEIKEDRRTRRIDIGGSPPM